MVELFKQHEKSYDLHSSKGNQLKWEDGNIWYKADYSGYEGLAEYVISKLLMHSTLTEREYVNYDLEQIKYGDNIYFGVKSENFLRPGEQIITLERLYKSVTGQSLYKILYQISDVKERLVFLEKEIQNITDLHNLGMYLNKLFTIDAIFLNEDRHLHNVAVLLNDDKYTYCPIFDNGAALLSDAKMDYPLSANIYDCMKNVHAKTISRDFDEQLDVSESLYGNNIKFSFTKEDVRNILKQADIYPLEIRNRVEEIIYSQMMKYQYLFK